jgi:hypothetical protein
MYLSSFHIVPRQYSGFTTMLQELESSTTRNKVGAFKCRVEKKGTPFFRGALCFGPVEFDARKGYANKLPL